MDLAQLEEKDMKVLEDAEWRFSVMLESYLSSGMIFPEIMWDERIPEGPVIQPQKAYPYIVLLFKDCPTSVFVGPFKSPSIFKDIIGFTPEDFLELCKKRNITPLVLCFSIFRDLDFLDEIIDISEGALPYNRMSMSLLSWEIVREKEGLPSRDLQIPAIWRKLYTTRTQVGEKLISEAETKGIGSASVAKLKPLWKEQERGLYRTDFGHWSDWPFKNDVVREFVQSNLDLHGYAEMAYSYMCLAGYDDWVKKLFSLAPTHPAGNSLSRLQWLASKLTLGKHILDIKGEAYAYGNRPFLTVDENEAREFGKFNSLAYKAVSDDLVPTFPISWALTLMDISGYKEKLDYRGRKPLRMRPDLSIDEWIELAENLSQTVKRGLDKRKYFYRKGATTQGIDYSNIEIPREKRTIEEIIRSMDAWGNKAESAIRFAGTSAFIFLVTRDAAFSFLSGLVSNLISEHLGSSPFLSFFADRFRNLILARLGKRLLKKLEVLHSGYLERPFVAAISRTKERAMPSEIREWVTDLWGIHRGNTKRNAAKSP